MRVVTVPGGPSIAVHDLGGTGPDVVLAHAAGFHGRVWAPLARRTAGDLHCIAYDARGHGDSVVNGDPVDGWDWRTLGLDALAVVDALALGRPFGLGHSSGATALLLAEAARPGTFAGLYCIEPIGPASLDPPPPPFPGHPMAVRARGRRNAFPSREAAAAAYGSRPPLSDLTAEAMWAYVEHGFADEADGTVSLRCRPEHEAHMYEYGFSHDAFRRLPDVRCPVVLARGSTSQVMTDEVLARWAARLPDGSAEVLDGIGHFAPLQDPALVAAAVVRAFAAMGRGPAGGTGSVPI